MEHKFKVGDWVEVRQREEILATLNEDGELENMPFMPEMLAFCGMRFQVYKRAHKTCDTVFPVRSRRLSRTYHLSTRCSGQAHGGCQAGCLLFWKEAWLRPCERGSCGDAVVLVESIHGGRAERHDERVDLNELTHEKMRPSSNADEEVFRCQATRLPYASTDLSWWDIRQYLEDYRSGNVSLWQILSGFTYSVYYNISQMGVGLGRAMEIIYDVLHPIWRGSKFPRKVGIIPEGQPTPTGSLNLREGELVRVKSHDEILKTLTTGSKNRGLWWDAEMVPYCGGTYRVLKRVSRIINEKTGMMQEMKTPCIILDEVVCQSRYSTCRYFCPRSIYPYWREIWLERV